MNRYKITLSSNTVYKEIELAPDAQQVKLGTGVDCDVRLRKELFFGQIELLLVRNGDGWSIRCSDNLYLTVGDVRKLMTKKLVHGDTLEIKYQDSDNLVFTMEFLIDFDDGMKKYERMIDASAASKLTIGAYSDCNISIGGEYVKDDAITLTRKGEDFAVNIRNTTYGVYINGKKAKTGDVIRNGDFLSMSDYFFYFKDGRIWTQTRPEMKINSLGFRDLPSKGTYPKFNRNTRVKTVVCEDDIEILDPPAPLQKPKNDLFSRLMPSVSMLLIAVIMAVVSDRSASMMLMSVMSAGMAIVTAIIGLRRGNKEYEEGTEERSKKYNEYIKNKCNDIETFRSDEKAVLDSIYISQAEEAKRFDSFSSKLFDRTPEDEDFLSVKLGNGAVEAKRQIKYKKQEKLEIDDELQVMPGQLCEKYKYIDNAPVVCSFKEINAVGIVGAPEDRYALLKNTIIDIVARQYFKDVRMVFVAQECNADKIHWLRKLPQVSVEGQSIRTIVTDDESKNIVFEYIYKELTLRQQSKKHDEHIVIFLFDEYGFKSHPISKFVENAKELGVTFVFFGDTAADVPPGCDRLISLTGNNSGCIMLTEDSSKATEFTYRPISTEDAEKIVDLMAPVYSEEISLEGTLTKSISMFEMLNILAVDDIDLERRWKTSEVYKSMAAPLGVSKSGVVYLDLHDKAHGPHGLVAGTTGSGKSEILQTYILSMATLFHPYEVGFVIIDFKGGGMVNQFKDLPHLMGAITNIDGKEIERSLKSIKAELQKRQRLFADAEVNHIDKYIRKFKSGEVEIPLPHLIVIVDEFAELKAEQPEFMKELISAARIGRSLGVHLILATQKPSGQVNEQIWSNSKFKLCLKVQSQEDSNEVIKSPLAAEIKEPGRAYLQVGNNEIFELFQSAYSGAPEKIDDASVKEFTVRSVSACGKRTPVFAQKRKKSDGLITTQLDAIVEYVNLYSQKAGIEKLPNICLPPLKHLLQYSNDDVGEMSVPAGIYDDPGNQLQESFGINIFTENTIIIGSSMTGKTNLLQLVIKGVANKFTPSEVTLYIIDFASMVLKNFEKLNHVGGVVVSNEDEKLKNLFKLLNEEIAERKEKLLTAGVSNFIAYKEAGNTDLSQIVLLIDNLTALKELYFGEDDLLLPICRDGLSVGISVVIANSQTSGIGFKYFSNINQRIGLACNDPSEYHYLFDHCRIQPENTPGRCLIQRDKENYEAQTYLAFEGQKEFERVQEIAKFIADTNSKYTQKAKRIPVVPEILLSNMLVEEYGVASDENRLFIGLNYANVMPVALDYCRQDILALSGSCVEAKALFINYLKTSFLSLGTELYILDDYSETFSDLAGNDYVELYSKSADDLAEMLSSIKSILAERYAAREMYGNAALKQMKPIVLIINTANAAAYISENSAVLNNYKEIVKKYKNLRSLILFTNIENEAIVYGSPEVMKMMKDNYQFIMFEDLNAVKLFDCPISLLKKFKAPLKDNEAYFLSGSELKKVKLVLR